VGLNCGPDSLVRKALGVGGRILFIDGDPSGVVEIGVDATGVDALPALGRSGLRGGGDGGNLVCRRNGEGGVGLFVAAYVDAGKGDCLYDATGSVVEPLAIVSFCFVDESTGAA